VGRLWEENVVVYFKISSNLSGRTEKNLEMPVRIGRRRAEFRIRELPNTRQQCFGAAAVERENLMTPLSLEATTSTDKCYFYFLPQDNETYTGPTLASRLLVFMKFVY
jgi:hypothetical protein